MEIKLKTQFIMIIIAIFCFIKINSEEEYDYICTLDGLRAKAAEACEDLFENVHSKIEKREISNYIENNEEKHFGHKAHHHHHKIHMAKVWKSSFPNQGYLLLNVDHAKILAKKDPKYKWEHVFKNPSKIMRTSKREKRETEGTVLTYCCLETCKADYFCT